MDYRLAKEKFPNPDTFCLESALFVYLYFTILRVHVKFLVSLERLQDVKRLSRLPLSKCAGLQCAYAKHSKHTDVFEHKVLCITKPELIRIKLVRLQFFCKLCRLHWKTTTVLKECYTPRLTRSTWLVCLLWRERPTRTRLDCQPLKRHVRHVKGPSKFWIHGEIDGNIDSTLNGVFGKPSR